SIFILVYIKTFVAGIIGGIIEREQVGVWQAPPVSIAPVFKTTGILRRTFYLLSIGSYIERGEMVCIWRGVSKVTCLISAPLLYHQCLFKIEISGVIDILRRH